MAHITSNIVGANLNRIEKASKVAELGGQPSIAVNTKGFTSNNRLARFGKAGAALASGLATCSFATNGTVSATGGTYVAPTVTGGLSTGDYAWFTKPAED